MDDVQEDYGVAGVEHLELMFEAITDTLDGVTGSEGFGLTRAQQYAFAVLGAGDDLTHQQKVDGNESFFGAIGDGLKAIWNYIMKMFNGISSFFFGTSENSAEQKTKKTEIKVKVNADSLSSVLVAKPTPTTDATWTKMAHIDSVEALDKFMGSSDATPAEAAQVKAIIDKVPEHPTPAEKAHAVKEVAEAVGRLNRRQKQHLIEQVTRVNKITEDFNTMVMKDESAQFAGTEFESMYHSFHTDLQDSNGLDIAEFSRIHNLKDAIAAQTIITRMLHTDLGGQRLFIVAQKGPIISKVKLLEKQVAIAGKRGNSAEEAQFRKDLTACKIFLSLTTRLAKQIETCDEGLKQISTTIMRLFGMAHA